VNIAGLSEPVKAAIAELPAEDPAFHVTGAEQAHRTVAQYRFSIPGTTIYQRMKQMSHQEHRLAGPANGREFRPARNPIVRQGAYGGDYGSALPSGAT
jgi:hypothetical protein